MRLIPTTICFWTYFINVCRLTFLLWPLFPMLSRFVDTLFPPDHFLLEERHDTSTALLTFFSPSLPPYLFFSLSLSVLSVPFSC